MASAGKSRPIVVGPSLQIAGDHAFPWIIRNALGRSLMNRKTLELTLISVVACLGLDLAWAREDIAFAGIFAAQATFALAAAIHRWR
jgi:hypothetical protein